MIKAGVHFKLWLADSFAWINNKMSGDQTKIRKVGEYFIEVWKAAGVDDKKVEFLWSSDAMGDKEYWKTVVTIAKNTTLNRANRALTIMGRKEGELQEVAQYFYPVMQATDVFYLNADICQLGLDQRRANMLARDVAPRLKRKPPIIVSHHMLMGLQGIRQPEGFEENKQFDIEISSKMSKSKPHTTILVHDSKEEIRQKINSAFCPEKTVEGNPVLEYSKYLIFKKFKSMKIERNKKFGGDLEFDSYHELEKMFREGKLHPADLKNSVSMYLDQMIEPIRKHFEKDRKAKKLYEFVKKQEITR